MRIFSMMMTGMFVLLMSATVQAKIEENIACPSIDVIHNIAPLLVKTVKRNIYNNLYYAHISNVQDNGLSWEISSGDIIAKSDEEAAAIVKKRCAKVTDIVYPNVRKSETLHVLPCLYYDRTQANPFIYVDAVPAG